MILTALENGRLQATTVATPHFDYTADVLCIGAGSAGVYAADSAAREGASVILCELAENIGGMHVCGGVTGYYYGARGGSYEGDDEESRRDTVFLAKGAQWEMRQIRLTERLGRSGVRVLCRYSATGLLWEGNRVIGIRAFDGQGERYLRAAITIDATSDGHLIRMTNVEKRYGKPTDGSYVPFTVRTQYIKNGRFLSSNSDSGTMDHYDALDFSRGTVLAHANAAALLKDGEMINLATQTGVREGLTFLGEDTVSYRDILLGKHPERILFRAYSDLDRHGSERATDEELFQSFWVVANLATVTASIPVPMGSVVPKGIRGLVSAGRCLSADTYSQSAIRMNRDMFRMGECVGIAAAMAVAAGVDFTEIDYEEYRHRAEARGSFAGFADRNLSFDDTYAAYLKKMRSLGRTPDPRYEGLAPLDYIHIPLEFDLEKSFPLLATDTPGVAIWSAYLSPDRAAAADRLSRAMSTAEEDLTRYNCAIALGLLGDERALPTLRRIVRERDCFFFKDNRRSNQFRSAVAVCLLGRLGTEEDLPLLTELLEPEELEREMYHTLPADYLYHTEPDRNFVYFAMLTHACMAICKIYRRRGLDMQQLHGQMQGLFAGDTLLRRVTDARPGEPAYEEMQSFMQYVLRFTRAEE